MRFLVLHGPNLDLLGTRDPATYGSRTLAEVNALVEKAAAAGGHSVDCRQSNHEGELIDALHAARGSCDGVLVNAGALTHTSVALRDAIEAIGLPVVEVHLSNIHAREPFRRKSMIAEVCRGVVCGFGAHSYVAALHALVGLLSEQGSV